MIDRNEIRTILQNNESEPILSLYLQVDASLPENQSDTPAWRIAARNALKEVEEGIDENDEDAQSTWKTVRSAVEEFLAEYEPDDRGVVLFFGPTVRQHYELPVRPTDNQHAYGHMLLSPLLWLLDEYEQYLIVIASSEEAYFLTTSLGGVTGRDEMVSDKFQFDFRERRGMPPASAPQSEAGIGATGGSQKDRYQSKVEETITRFLDDVAERAHQLFREMGRPRVFIGGTERAAHRLADELHQEVRDLLVGVLPIPMDEDDATVMNRIMPHAAAYERQQEAQLVENTISAAKAGGRAALGYEDVQQALAMYQVDTLIAPWPPQDVTQLDEMTIQVLQGGGQVELVSGAAADQLAEHGGLAARLHT